MLMVCPVLQDHITAELHKEAQIMKEKRKLKEERAASRGGGGASASGKGSELAKLQSRIDAQAATIKKLESQLAGKANGKGDKGN